MSEVVNVSPAEQSIDDALNKFGSDVKALSGPGSHTIAQELIDGLNAVLKDLVPALPNVAQALNDAKANPISAVAGVAAAVAPVVGE